MLWTNPCSQKENWPVFSLFCVSPCMVVTQAATLVPSTWKCGIASRPTLLLYNKFNSKDLLVWLWTLHTCNNHNSRQRGCGISHCFKEKSWEHYGIRLFHQLSTIQHLLNGGNFIMEPHSTSSMELCNNIAKHTHNCSSNDNPCPQLNPSLGLMFPHTITSFHWAKC
jgi:hypothetical protein